MVITANTTHIANECPNMFVDDTCWKTILPYAGSLNKVCTLRLDFEMPHAESTVLKLLGDKFESQTSGTKLPNVSRAFAAASWHAVTFTPRFKSYTPWKESSLPQTTSLKTFPPSTSVVELISK